MACESVCACPRPGVCVRSCPLRGDAPVEDYADPQRKRWPVVASTTSLLNRCMPTVERVGAVARDMLSLLFARSLKHTHARTDGRTHGRMDACVRSRAHFFSPLPISMGGWPRGRARVLSVAP
eukprot:376414-Pleurochrysis_carterae.AAC.2